MSVKVMILWGLSIFPFPFLWRKSKRFWIRTVQPPSTYTHRTPSSLDQRRSQRINCRTIPSQSNHGCFWKEQTRNHDKTSGRESQISAICSARHCIRNWEQDGQGRCWKRWASSFSSSNRSTSHTNFSHWLIIFIHSFVLLAQSLKVGRLRNLLHYPFQCKASRQRIVKPSRTDASLPRPKESMANNTQWWNKTQNAPTWAIRQKKMRK